MSHEAINPDPFEFDQTTEFRWALQAAREKLRTAVAKQGHTPDHYFLLGRYVNPTTNNDDSVASFVLAEQHDRPYAGGLIEVQVPIQEASVRPEPLDDASHDYFVVTNRVGSATNTFMIDNATYPHVPIEDLASKLLNSIPVPIRIFHRDDS